MTEPASPARSGRPAAPSAPRAAGRASAPVTGARQLSRIKNRRKAGPLYKVAMIVFTVGLLAICVDAVIFVAGARDIPLWLHLLTVLAPLGLGLGLVGTMLEARRDRQA